MPYLSKKLNEVQISQVAEFVSESTQSSTMGGSVAAGFKPDDTKIADCKADDFHCFEQAFANISYKDSPKTAHDLFDKDIKTPGPIERDCHRIAHAIGAGALSHFHGNIGQAFVAGRPSCTSATTTGSSSAPSSASPKGSSGPRRASSAPARSFASRNSSPTSACTASDTGSMIYTGYDLPLSLHTCDKLQTSGTSLSCTGGVFMENILSRRTAITSRWLKDDGPDLPVQRPWRRSTSTTATTW